MYNKCTPLDILMYPWGYMYPRLGIPVLACCKSPNEQSDKHVIPGTTEVLFAWNVADVVNLHHDRNLKLVRRRCCMTLLTK